MSESPKYVNCRNFINLKIKEKIGKDLEFITNKTIAVIKNIDTYAKFYESLTSESLTNKSLGNVSIQKNGEGNIVFFSTIPATSIYDERSRWGFQLKENKKEFLDKYTSKLNLFSSII